jgi:hypothetical protein
LFTLCLARLRPGLTVTGIDNDARRIAVARAAAVSVGATNAVFENTDLRAPRLPRECDGLLAHRVLHVLATSAADHLTAVLRASLRPGAPLLVLDTDVRPRWRWALASLPEVFLHPSRPHSYYAPEARLAQLQRAGFRELNSLPLAGGGVARTVAIWGRA